MKMRKPKGGLIELMNLRPAFNWFKRLDYGRESLPDNACMYFWLSIFNFLCILQVVTCIVILPSFFLEELLSIPYLGYFTDYIPGVLYLGMVAGILFGMALTYIIPIAVVAWAVIYISERAVIPDSKTTSIISNWIYRACDGIYKVYKRVCPELTDE